jgi:putative oxidoreductase
MKDIFDLFGRIFISFIFFFEAYDALFFFKDTKKQMTEYGLLWQQDFLLYLSIFILILGSLLILLGYRPSFGAILLLLYWLPMTFIVFPFWEAENDVRREVSVHFMKNMAISGGLFLVLVNGAGRWSMRRLFATSYVR